MRITTIRSRGLAALSYFLSSDGQAIVIDPRRDASVYYELARDEDVKIQHIFETHRNEDLVTGSVELQALTPDAAIGHSSATDFRYGNHSLADGEAFTVGKMRVACLHTPGHTDDSICFAVSDTSTGPEPITVFTGDTLLVNEVGRTDLVGKRKHREMSQKMYDSLHQRILPLGDGVIIHPGHGAGSVCGGSIADREFSTIGFEKSHNAWLKMNEETFIESKVKQRLTLAPYFKHCEQLNTKGPPLLSATEAPQELNPAIIESLLQDPNHRVLDTRLPGEYVKQHIPGTISMGLSGMGRNAGWALKPNQSFSFVLEDRKDFADAWSYLVRVGLDNILGFLDNGLISWKKSGRALGSIQSISVDELNQQLKQNKTRIIDVREPHEFDQEHIDGSVSCPLTQLPDKKPSIDPKTPIATLCPSGFRSTTAASMLKQMGFVNVVVPLGGLKAWKAQGLPLED